MANLVKQLDSFGQSAWLDNINRSMIESGQLKKMIKQGLLGQTSNPTIFDKAISSGSDYDKKIQSLVEQGKTGFEIYDALTIKDVQDATDLFKEVYKRTNGRDGYVSLEINPKFAHSLTETINEGKRLYKKVNRPNLMLKVPATEAGFKAIEEFISLGMNVNATLIFSLEQYNNTVNAYMKGIKRLLEKGGDASKVQSVASVFVSRIDGVIDKRLDNMITNTSNEEEKKMFNNLKGKAAVANTSRIYGAYCDVLSSAEFKEFKNKGVWPQRALWASTSTKNPDYNDVKYVEELIAKDTVNTLPDQTLAAFMDHGKVEEALTVDTTSANETIRKLKSIGIDIDEVCQELLKKGVIAFEDSFDSLMDHLDSKAKKMAGSKK